MSRLRPYWVACAVVAAIVAAAGVFGLEQPIFHLKTLTVSGLTRVSRATVVAHAAIDPSVNVWFLDKRAIESRIESIPYVRGARVHRRPIGNVAIDIVERDPNACVRDNLGRVVTIDRDNRILQDDCVDPTLVSYALRAPIASPAGAYVRTRELTELESDDGTLATDTTRFRAFSYDRFGELVALMPSGISVQFGDGDLDRKERLIAPILAQLGLRAHDVKSVDLRAIATPVVEYRAPAIHRHPQAVDTQ